MYRKADAHMLRCNSVQSANPQAHEDDAERAVRSGLDSVNVVPALKTRGDVQLRMRVGIATGMEAYMVPVSMCALAAGEGDFDAAYREGARAEEVWSSIGGRFFSLTVKAYVALACLNLGRSDEAVRLIGEAIDHIESTDELMYAEEIYRVAGLVQLKHKSDQNGATNFYHKSLTYSKQHGTKSFELRTAMCLTRLWRAQGMCQQAYELISPIYTRFTEAFFHFSKANNSQIVSPVRD